MGETPARVLVVEDERRILTGLRLNLELDGYEVLAASSLSEARQAVAEGSPSLILLDLMLSDGSGLALCRELRGQRDFTPIIILTAKDSAEDVVQGLEAGADDYLTKPFNLKEVLTRVRITFRRLRWDAARDQQEGPTLEVGAAVVNWDAHEFVRDGETRRLTGLEVRLLSYFVENAGKTLTREDLLREVWGLTGYQTRTVDNFVARMRKYFEADPAKPAHFVTVRGTGYRYEP